jgi:hypothetical protein
MVNINMIPEKRRDIRSSILRLGRMGAERSKTIIKVRESARSIMNYLIEILPRGIEFSRGYRVVLPNDKNGDAVLALIKVTDGVRIFEHEYGKALPRRATALMFARDLATGLLTEITKELEGQGDIEIYQEDDSTIDALRSLANELERKAYAEDGDTVIRQ